jgi:cobalt-zinc-cadmium efflux system outer membrane protein
MKPFPRLLAALPLLALAEPLTLPAFLELIEAQNPDLRAARAATDAARSGEPLARALPDPEIEFMFETMDGDTDFRSVELRQSLPARGMRGAGQKMTRAETEAAEASADALLARLRGDAVRRWADLAAMDAEIALQQERIALWETLVAVAEARVRGGAPARDLWRAEDRLAMAKDMLQTLQSRRTGMAAALTRLARRDPGAPLTLPDPTDPTDLSDQTPILRQAAAMESMADAEADMARAERRPMVMFMLEQEFAPSSGMGNDATMASVGFSIPLWPGKNRARTERAAALREAAAAESVAMRDMQDADVHMYKNNLADARRRQDFLTEDLLPRAENTLAVTRDAYRAGTAPFTDLLESEDRLLQLRLSHILARRDALRAAAGFETLGFPFTWSEQP